VTDLKVTLKVGAASETVVVQSGTPLVETTSNAIATTIDMKQINELPLQGRNIATLAFLSAGYSGTPVTGGGTWNGLPVIAQGNSIDGVISSTSRMKFSGNVQPGLQARLEDLEEMTVQTSQVDLNQSLGTSAMQVSFVTKRGSNDYHGQIFEDFRNSALNANTWHNDAVGLRKNALILNEFGGTIGGHIIKDSRKAAGRRRTLNTGKSSSRTAMCREFISGWDALHFPKASRKRTQKKQKRNLRRS
jgi:hypothetical protein